MAVEVGLGRSLGVGRSRFGRLEGRRRRGCSAVVAGLGVDGRLVDSLGIVVGRAVAVERGRSARNGSLWARMVEGRVALVAAAMSLKVRRVEHKGSGVLVELALSCCAHCSEAEQHCSDMGKLLAVAIHSSVSHAPIVEQLDLEIHGDTGSRVI